MVPDLILLQEFRSNFTFKNILIKCKRKIDIVFEGKGFFVFLAIFKTDFKINQLKILHVLSCSVEDRC